MSTEAGKIGFAADKQILYWDMIQAQLDAGKADQAFDYAERGKARALVDMLASKQAFGREGSERNQQSLQAVEAIAASEKQQQVQTREKFEAFQSGSRGLTPETLPKFVERELASLVTVSASSTNEITGFLRADETLVEYYGEGDDLVVFVMRADGSVKAIRTQVEQLGRQVQSFRRVLQNPRDERYKPYARSLYRQLIAPVVAAGASERLIIVPHGALHYLPFGALQSSAGPLVERFSYRILPSASVLEFLEERHQKEERLLVLGNPALGDPKLDLPYAEQEARAIGRADRSVQVLLRGDATETQIKQAGAGFSRLHFASHGVFDAEKPLASRLLLAKDAANDGNLTVSELYDLERDVNLVTLSACETGLGKVANGDDVVGFTRGFLFAGARTIVSSLWQVDDQATMELMLRFYRELESRSARDALREAQRHLIATGKDHPYYWSAFQVTGASG